MIKANVFVVSSLIVATVLGVYAQDITYFIVGNLINNISLFQCITVVTVSSWFLYVGTFVLTYFYTKKKIFSENLFLAYAVVFICVGGWVSLRSLFIFAMWGG